MSSETISSPAGRLRQGFEPRAFTILFARLLALMTVILISAGALVTGNKAALADPMWPKFVNARLGPDGEPTGQWYPSRELFMGGLRYEDTHRVIAGTVGFLALGFALWLQFREKRSWVRKLAWWGVALVVAQALFGGLIIHSKNEKWVSMVHACLAQGFLLITVALAVVTGRRWGALPAPVDGACNRSLRATLTAAVVIVYVQLILGSGVRHSEGAFLVHLTLHILGGFAVIATVAWSAIRITTEHRDLAALRKPVLTAAAVLALQIAMGIYSIFANRARLEPQMPRLDHVLVSTAHVATGAVLLAILLTLALRARAVLAVPGREPAAGPLAEGVA